MWNAKYIRIVKSLIFKLFLGGLFVATITILARSVYRCVELWGGFESDLFMGHEVTFMVLEGVMCIIACSCLTFLHPGICFRGAFHEVAFRFRSKKGASVKSVDGSFEEFVGDGNELQDLQGK